MRATRALVAAVAATGATLVAACNPGVAAPAHTGTVAAPAAGAVRPSSAAPAGTAAPAAPVLVQPAKAANPSPKPQARPRPAVGAPCSATARACVDLSANQAWLLKDGNVVYGPVPITSGKPGHRTPPGTYRVQWKDKDHRSSEFNNAPMPYSVFFYSGMAFHAGSLNAQSHGCIHLSTAAAKTFFNVLAVGDVVQIVP
ncbi:L,D-transpeptidase [Gandjariella thermophila]|uniref:L,D-TPase catalytic domain-containing protein n=1 Tax=Gandjariella thermophila TaxID=1931992 RepID=A0A4D4J4C0_9PSEU|nr:L,D-transpeptidase [Gandjariella thermophila]GDY29932.1 hypothetical protein GTS_15650 [Gandjariella thermophila]